MRIEKYESKYFDAWLGSRTKEQIIERLTLLVDLTYERETDKEKVKTFISTLPEKKPNVELMDTQDIIDWWLSLQPYND